MVPCDVCLALSDWSAELRLREPERVSLDSHVTLGFSCIKRRMSAPGLCTNRPKQTGTRLRPWRPAASLTKSCDARHKRPFYTPQDRRLLLALFASSSSERRNSLEAKPSVHYWRVYCAAKLEAKTTAPRPRFRELAEQYISLSFGQIFSPRYTVVGAVSDAKRRSSRRLEAIRSVSDSRTKSPSGVR
jgi:hypothetical protein